MENKGILHLSKLQAIYDVSSIGYSEGILGYAIRRVGSKKDPKCKDNNEYVRDPIEVVSEE